MTRLFLWPVAVIAGLLPVRRWAAFDAVLPVRKAAPLAGLVTLLAGFAIGLRGYLIYMQAFVERISDQAALDAAATAGDAGLPLGAWVIPAAIGFAFTPTGATAAYLCLTGLLRGISGYVDDPRGDPLLTLLDSGATRPDHGNASDSPPPSTRAARRPRCAGSTRHGSLGRPCGCRLRGDRGSAQARLGRGGLRDHRRAVVSARPPVRHAVATRPADRVPR